MGYSNRFKNFGIIDNRFETDDPPYAYGIRKNWATTSSILTRIGKAIGMSFNTTIGTTVGANDFENALPWSEIKRCNLADDGTVNAFEGEPGFVLDGSNGQVMVSIPKFYYKFVNVSIDVKESWISPHPYYGYRVHPAFIVNGVEKSHIFVAAYMGAEESAKMVSKTNVLPQYDKTRAQFRALARARGAGWGICDLTSYSALQLLLMVMTANMNAQTAVGKGISEMPYTTTHLAVIAETATNRIVISNANAANYLVGYQIGIGTTQGGNQICLYRQITSIAAYDASNMAITFDGAAVNIAVGNMLYSVPMKTGGADEVGQHTGRAAGTDGKTEISMLGVQGMWGNWWQFIDGANMDSSYYMWYNDNPATHADDVFEAPYKRINHVLPSAADGYVRRFGNDPEEPWSMLTAETGGDSAGPIGDYFWRSSTPANRVLLVGGSWFNGSSVGPWDWFVSFSSSLAIWYFGARLLYKPV